jgi:hypothetical protein
VGGGKAIYTIHKVEPNRPAFIVKIGNSEKELLLGGGILSVKPIKKRGEKLEGSGIVGEK